MRDVAIVGGGLVGLCAALVLARAKHRVSVIEAGKFDNAPVEGLAARSIALSASSVQIFRALGIWQELEKHAAAIRLIHVSARARWGVTRLQASDYQLDALGYVIENRHLTEVLLREAWDCSDIDLHLNAGFESIQQAASVSIDYRVDDRQQSLDARLALIADGAQSRAREALGIGHRSIDYGQTVVIANVEVDAPKDGAAYERFTEEGPLAMLPLGGRRYACVWTVSAEHAALLEGLGNREFIKALQDCFGYRLGLIEAVGPRFAFALQRVHAETLGRGRCVLIGNAANALHPVAGQSFNLSLRDIASLYELLLEQPLELLDDAGFATLLARYQQDREREQQRVIRYGDGLVTLFSNRLPGLDHARAAALGLLDLLPALKSQAALTGMGLAYGGNRLLRGHL